MNVRFGYHIWVEKSGVERWFIEKFGIERWFTICWSTCVEMNLQMCTWGSTPHVHVGDNVRHDLTSICMI